MASVSAGAIGKNATLVTVPLVGRACRLKLTLAVRNASIASDVKCASNAPGSARAWPIWSSSSAVTVGKPVPSDAIAQPSTRCSSSPKPLGAAPAVTMSTSSGVRAAGSIAVWIISIVLIATTSVPPPLVGGTSLGLVRSLASALVTTGVTYSTIESGAAANPVRAATAPYAATAA